MCAGACSVSVWVVSTKPPPWRSPVQPGRDQYSVTPRAPPRCRAQARPASLPTTMVPPPGHPQHLGAALLHLSSPAAPALGPMVLSAARREIPVRAHQAPVGWDLWGQSSPLRHWTAVLVQTISYLPALTAAPCLDKALWVAPSLVQVPPNSMDLVPVGPACPTLPLTVVLLVISEVSLRLAGLAPLVLLSHSARVQTGPVAPTVPHTAGLRGLTGLTSF